MAQLEKWKARPPWAAGPRSGGTACARSFSLCTSCYLSMPAAKSGCDQTGGAAADAAASWRRGALRLPITPGGDWFGCWGPGGGAREGGRTETEDRLLGPGGDLVRIDDGLASEVNLQLGAALLIVVAGAVAKCTPFGCVVKGASLATGLRVARRPLARL